MQKISTILSLMALALTISLTGCGGGGGAEEGDGDEATSGGEIPAEYQGAITGDATAGAELYDQACAGCHDGSGGPELAGVAWSAAATRQQVREGDDEMPPFPESRVSAEDLENILAHMVTIGAVTE